MGVFIADLVGVFCVICNIDMSVFVKKLGDSGVFFRCLMTIKNSGNSSCTFHIFLS